MPWSVGPTARARFDSRWMLAWWFPAAYVVHMAEEFWGGFYRWMGRFGFDMTATDFLVINAPFLLGMIAWVTVAQRRRSMWMIVTLATIVFINGVAHALGTLATRTYSPGLVSGLLLYVPSGLVTLVLSRRTCNAEEWRRGVLIGAIVHALVPVVAWFVSNA